MKQKILSHRERMEVALSGEKPDRIPVAFWRHFPVDDQKAESLARATLTFQNTFDLDLVKVSPASSFCLNDWGIKTEWKGNVEGTREYINKVIFEPADWLKLPELDPNRGSLGEQLKCLQLLRNTLSSDTPFIQTIFNPLSQAKHLIEPELLKVHIRKYPEAVMAGLNTIQESTLNFIRAAKKTGISGIFLAVQHANYQLLTEEEYFQFGTHFDLAILDEMKDLWLNMAHIHGSNIMFKRLSSYPVQILNWHDQETPPTLGEAQELFDGVVCGGLHTTDTLVLGTPEKVRAEIKAAIAATDSRRFILGTGCVVPINAPYGNLMAACDYLRKH